MEKENPKKVYHNEINKKPIIKMLKKVKLKEKVVKSTNQKRAFGKALQNLPKEDQDNIYTRPSDSIEEYNADLIQNFKQILNTEKKLENCSSEYLIDIYEFMSKSINKFIIKIDYLSFQTEINEEMRKVLIDWLIDLKHTYSFSHDSLFSSVSIIDRFLSMCFIPRDKLQLLGITALLICSKFLDIHPLSVNISAELCNEIYTSNEILRMEELILKTISFNIFIPNSYNFYEIHSFINNLSISEHNKGLHYLYLTLLEYSFTQINPETISHSIIIQLIDKFQNEKMNSLGKFNFKILDDITKTSQLKAISNMFPEY